MRPWEALLLNLPQPDVAGVSVQYTDWLYGAFAAHVRGWCPSARELCVGEAYGDVRAWRGGMHRAALFRSRRCESERHSSLATLSGSFRRNSPSVATAWPQQPRVAIALGRDSPDGFTGHDSMASGTISSIGTERCWWRGGGNCWDIVRGLDRNYLIFSFRRWTPAGTPN